MKNGIVTKEFYIGRFIYLQSELDSLPNIMFVRQGTDVAVSIKKPGKKEARYNSRNPKWPEYERLARRRIQLKDQMKKLMKQWGAEYTGSLKSLASEYMLVPNTKSVYNSRLWRSLKADTNPYEKSRTYSHNGVIMRSVFETDVAQILEDMGIEYKYEVTLNLGEDGYVNPDMAIHFPEYNRCGFIEALGRLEEDDYVTTNVKKINKYTKAGLYMNRDIQFIPSDGFYRPEQRLIKKMIAVICDAMALQYVVKRPGH